MAYWECSYYTSFESNVEPVDAKEAKECAIDSDWILQRTKHEVESLFTTNPLTKTEVDFRMRAESWIRIEFLKLILGFGIIAKLKGLKFEVSLSSKSTH